MRSLRHQRAGKSDGGLTENVAGDIVAAGCIGRGKPGERSLSRRRTPEFEKLPVIVVAAATSDKIDHRSGAAAILRCEGIRQNGHLVDGHQWNIGEKRL